MRQVVICEPVRTPIGRYGGTLKPLSAAELVEIALRGLLDRTGLDPAAVDDVVLGHCYPSSEAPAIGRVVALNAGLPVTVPGMQVDRRCGSGLQSVLIAGLQVGSGGQELVVAGGAESMSNVPFYPTEMRWGVKGPGVTLHDGLARGRVTAGGRDYPVPGGMLETAENLRREYGISRAERLVERPDPRAAPLATTPDQSSIRRRTAHTRSPPGGSLDGMARADPAACPGRGYERGQPRPQLEQDDREPAARDTQHGPVRRAVLVPAQRDKTGKASGSTGRSFGPDAVRHMSVTIATR